ncbi:hypothetical protein WICPIJ_000840 [Wickerhamomyces pijperi]|uniref:Uncharacterized protein n=1 Tax=Wickerhamomyces pijperi TaxID=599730 RepID=A0A9P8QCX3_WICPI|nr:hypothetical protein WICPIJ_000840 [Wickerhamomyces pijperi]
MDWPFKLTALLLLPAPLLALLETLALICLAMVKKACSTLVEFKAEVSKNGISKASANSLATLYSTDFLSVKSDLLPTNNFMTPPVAYLSISCNHCLTLLNDS